jgi:hypothetical protein
MAFTGKAAADAQIVQVFPSRKPGASSSAFLENGQTVHFRVLESKPGNRYRILVQKQTLSVQSRVPLEEGGRYLAEVKIRQGAVQLLSRPIPANAIEALLAQKQSLKTPLASLLRALVADASLPAGFATDCRTAGALRTALLNCGLFYEARVREALGKRIAPSLGKDLKLYLLSQAGKHPVSTVRDTIGAALKQLEIQQLLTLQEGPEGAVPFWLPFGEDEVVEGFMKRLERPRGTEFLVTFRVPFLPAEDLLVTLGWTSGRLEVTFSAGPLAFGALRDAVHMLEDRLTELGIPRGTVRVSRGLPKKLQKKLEGIRFVESYG